MKALAPSSALSPELAAKPLAGYAMHVFGANYPRCKDKTMDYQLYSISNLINLRYVLLIIVLSQLQHQFVIMDRLAIMFAYEMYGCNTIVG